MNQGTLKGDASHIGKEAIITLGGLLTTVAVVGANFAVESAASFDFLSLSFWLVIPAGAVLGGWGAASGYYFTARFTHTMPSRTMLFNMVAIAIGAWVAYRWLGYATLTFEDGTSVSDAVSFSEYYRITTEAMQLNIGTRGNMNAITTGELGKLGYLRELLQVAGFASGGFISNSMLESVEACSKCRRYAKEAKLLEGVTPEALDSTLAQAQMTLPGLVDDVERVVTGRGFHGVGLNEYRCTQCGDMWLRPTVITGAQNSPKTELLGRYNVTPELDSSVIAAARTHSKSKFTRS